MSEVPLYSKTPENACVLLDMTEEEMLQIQHNITVLSVISTPERIARRRNNVKCVPRIIFNTKTDMAMLQIQHNIAVLSVIMI